MFSIFTAIKVIIVPIIIEILTFSFKKIILNEIAKNGINYGINREEIAKIIENKEKDTYIKIAEGIEKENGNG